MAKRRYRRRYYRSKGRWSSNIKTLTNQTISIAANSSFYGTSMLCKNPAQSDSTVSQQYTVKNIELSYEIEAVDQKFIEGLVSYIVYVPQGMVVTETYPNYHPEYIMAMKFLGSPNYHESASTTTNVESAYRNPLKIKTRLARRLQTGDSIQLLIVGNNSKSTSSSIDFNGIMRWWTNCAITLCWIFT